MASKKKEEQWGKAVRISLGVQNYLKKHQRGKESYDSVLRRMFGMPTTKGKAQELLRYFIVPNGTDPVIRKSVAEARGAAILLAARKGIKKAEAVIEVREIPKEVS